MASDRLVRLTEYLAALSAKVNSSELTTLLAAKANAADLAAKANPDLDPNLFVAKTCDPMTAGTGQVLPNAGRLQGARVYLSRPATVDGLNTNVLTVGAGLVNCKGGIWDASGALKATTVDQSAGWMIAGQRPMALTAPVLLQPGFYDLGFWWNGTTAPALGRGAANAGINANTLGQTLRFWITDNTGLTDTAPVTLGNKAATNNSYFIGLSGT